MPTHATTSPRPDVLDRFHRLATQWREESQYMSNTGQMTLLKSYLRIIGMGAPAVPLLLEELKRQPDHWFQALESITEENPVPAEDAGRVERMAAAWVEWGVRQGHVT